MTVGSRFRVNDQAQNGHANGGSLDPLGRQSEPFSTVFRLTPKLLNDVALQAVGKQRSEERRVGKECRSGGVPERWKEEESRRRSRRRRERQRATGRRTTGQHRGS